MNITSEYNQIRDKIETVAALATAAVRGAEVLDTEASDSLSDEVRLEAAASIWSGLMAGVSAVDC